MQQLEVWGNSTLSLQEWETRLESSFTFVAVDGGEIRGFGNLTCTGEIDLLYTHKDYQRKGIAANLLTQLETTAKSKGFIGIDTEASITAKPFFESKGYQVIKKQNKCIKDMFFLNFVMRKTL
ncbi:GNAT family N-acetyltransferase [Salipaludibacillus neizhouensis]|nr:GNAT family N-acetyltransferase [Salipaludibacillus neizhouensis]